MESFCKERKGMGTEKRLPIIFFILFMGIPATMASFNGFLNQ